METRSFEEIWQQLKKLQGKTIETLVSHWPNKIISVDSKEIIRCANRGQNTHHSKRHWEHAWEIINESNDKCCEISKSGPFVFACLAQLQEIEYSVNPCTLWLTENLHEFRKPVEKK